MQAAHFRRSAISLISRGRHFSIRQHAFKADLAEVLQVLEHSRAIIYFQGMSSIPAMLLLAGHTKHEVFAYVRYIFEYTDLRQLQEKNISKYQSLSNMIVELFLQRNTAVTISKDRNFLSRFELSLVNLLITLFTTHLGLSESLSAIAFVAKFGVQGLISLAISVLEMCLVNPELRNSLDDFYSELRMPFEPRYSIREKRHTVSFVDSRGFLWLKGPSE